MVEPARCASQRGVDELSRQGSCTAENIVPGLRGSEHQRDDDGAGSSNEPSRCSRP